MLEMLLPQRGLLLLVGGSCGRPPVRLAEEHYQGGGLQQVGLSSLVSCLVQVGAGPDLRVGVPAPGQELWARQSPVRQLED